MCSRIPKCRSFNFCARQVCVLNFDDVFSIRDPLGHLERDASCVYVGMLRNEAPKCRAQNSVLGSLSTGCLQECRIDEKPVDELWSPWKINMIADNSTHYKEAKIRDLILKSAHSGKKDSLGAEMVLKDLMWMREPRDKQDSQHFCNDNGGNLLSYGINQDLLDLICNKFENEPEQFGFIWLGICEADGKYVATDGVEMPDVWKYAGRGQPDGALDSGECVGQGCGDGLHDIKLSEKLPAVCDLKKY